MSDVPFETLGDNVRIGREHETDELIGRLEASPNAILLDEESRALSPLSRLASRGRAALPPAGARAVRPSSTTVGVEPALRHNWIPIGPRNVAGRVRGIACADPNVANPQIWFAGSAGGGVWKTTNGGRRWSTVWHTEATMEIAAVAVAPRLNPTHVYAATGESNPASAISVRSHGVFVSTDAGGTWSNHGVGGAANPNTLHGFDAIAAHATTATHCWAVGPDGAFRTLDGGTTWIQFEAGTHYTDVAFCEDRLYLVRGVSRAGEAALVRLDTPDADEGNVRGQFAAANSLSTVSAARPAHRRWPAGGKIAISPSAPSTAYVRLCTEDDRHMGVFRTTNARAPRGRDVNWTRLPDHPQWIDEGQGTYCMAIAVDPGAPGRVATGMVYLHASTNANAANAADVRWHRVMGWELNDEGVRGQHADQHQIVIAGNPSELWVADDGGVARCANWSTAGTIDHGDRLRPDPVRPLPPGSARFERRDMGISGAQMYDLAQSPLVPGVLAAGLQDNGTAMRAGGHTWRQVFGADGGTADFDPDDPFRLHIAYYAGLKALQFPALLDRLFADGARGAGAATGRTLRDGIDSADSSPFVPAFGVHPRQPGRLLLARNSRLYGLTPGTGELFRTEPLGRSFVIRVGTTGAVAGPNDVTINDTPGARRLGLIPGRIQRFDRSRITLFSRFPAPFRLTPGDHLTMTVNGSLIDIVFNAVAGVDPTNLAVANVFDLMTAAFAASPANITVLPQLWSRPNAVQLVTRDLTAAQRAALGANADTIVVGGTATTDLLPDGLSRLGLNAGTYRGDPTRGASVLLAFAGFDDTERLLNRDLGAAPPPTLDVTINGGAVRSMMIGALCADPHHTDAGELADALRLGLAADAVDIHPVSSIVVCELRPRPGSRVTLTGTAAARLGATPTGESVTTLGVPRLATRHQNLHVRNRCSVDLTPVPAAGVPLELIISDGANVTGPLRFTAASVANLRSVTSEELHRLIGAHLAIHAAVQVTADLFVRPRPGSITAIAFSPANDDHAWVGSDDGGVWRTEDGGLAWIEVTDPAFRKHDRPVKAIVLHPTDVNTAWIGLAGEATVAGDAGFLFRTTTGAAPWQLVGHQIVGGAAQGIVTAGLPVGINGLVLDAADGNTLYAATDAGVFRSRDTGTSWIPINDGLPNAPVVDVTIEPVTRILRAGLWTRGVFERRLDTGAPTDARLVIRATELDDGNRPPRRGPAYLASGPAPLSVSSPDIKVVRRRPAVGADVDVDGVVFDLELPSDDVIIPGTSCEVIVQVSNLGPVAVPVDTTAAVDPSARVVVVWAPASTGDRSGPPPLPTDFWMQLSAGTLAAEATLGSWTVVGDARLSRTLEAGSSAIHSFATNWPGTIDARRVGLLVLATASSDQLDGRALEVEALIASERRLAYSEVDVVAGGDDRTLVIRSSDAAGLVVEQPAAAAGITGVGDRLGFAAATLGAAGRFRVATTVATPTYPLNVTGPTLVVRRAAPIGVDITMLPDATEAGDPTAVWPFEVVGMLNSRLERLALPVEAFDMPTGIQFRCNSGTRIRATAGAAAGRLGIAIAANAAAATAVLQSAERTGWFDLDGAAALNLDVRVGAAGFPVAVNLSPDHFADAHVADPNVIAAVVRDALADQQLDHLVSVDVLSGFGLRALGQGLVSAGGALAPTLLLPAGPDRVLVSSPPQVDLSAGPILHIDVTPRAVIRFDGDPADIPDLAIANPGDVRRAINLACEISGVAARAEAARFELRVAASPPDISGAHPVLGGFQLAELVSTTGVDASTFEVRTALGADRLEVGVNNPLFLRVLNSGNVAATPARIRVFELALGTPITRVDIQTLNPAIEPAATQIVNFAWDPGGLANRDVFVMVVADQDADGRRVDVPPDFADTATLLGFATNRPGVAVRSFRVVEP